MVAHLGTAHTIAIDLGPPGDGRQRERVEPHTAPAVAYQSRHYLTLSRYDGAPIDAEAAILCEHTLDRARSPAVTLEAHTTDDWSAPGYTAAFSGLGATPARCTSAA